MKQLWQSRNFVGMLFMLPAAAFLLLFLVYPMGLGIWLSFTDAKIGEPGNFVGLENYQWIIGDPKFQTAVFFTLSTRSSPASSSSPSACTSRSC